MTLTEYREFQGIKKSLRTFSPTYGCLYTIRTDASEEYKTKLDALYAAHNLHPASIKVDKVMFDDKERIIYIYGRNDRFTDCYGRKFGWEGLYTAEEKARFAAALTDSWNA